MRAWPPRADRTMSTASSSNGHTNAPTSNSNRWRPSAGSGGCTLFATRSIAGVFAGHGLQIGEFDVLAALRRSGDPFMMKPTDLARVLMLSPAGMTNRVDRLEAAGWIDGETIPTIEGARW